MIRGIAFRCPRIGDTLLQEILDGINIFKYNWYSINEQNEAWTYANDYEEEFLEKVRYEGECLQKIIQKKHYIVFLKMEAYSEVTNIYNVHSYEQFQNSNCKMIILIYDCEYVEIYAKEQGDINILYENAKDKEFVEIEYITDTNDMRMIMDVL